MNNNKPIWKDYPLQVSGGTYVIKEYVGGSWVTRRTFHALANPRGNADVCVNNMLCNDLKTGYPSVTGVTTHSDAWRRYECQTGATTGATEAFNFCQDWSWEDWDGEQRTLSCPINGHADMRQRLFRSRFGELSENIEIKALVRPNFNYYYVDSVAAETTSGFITVTANEEYSISCDATWITGLSGVTGDTGEETFFFNINPYTGITDRNTTIVVTYLNFEGEYVSDELLLTQRGIIPFFNVSPTALTISWESGTTYVTVNTNVPFTVSDNQSWLEYSGQTQTGIDAWNVFFNYESHIGYDREAVITFTYPISSAQSGTTTVALTQNGSYSCNYIFYQKTSSSSFYPNVTEGWGAEYLGNNFIEGYLRFASCPTTIPMFALSGFTGVISISLPNSITQMGNYAFRNNTNLSAITLSNNLTNIGGVAFSGCKSLSSITIPDSVTVIGSGAFSGCESLSSLTIGSGVTSIEQSAFSGCKALPAITIPDSVTKILGSAFYNNINIESITFGSGLTYIEDRAFYYLGQLAPNKIDKVIIPSNVTTLRYDAFKGSNIKELILNCGTLDTGYTEVFAFSTVESVTVNTERIITKMFRACNSLTSVTFTDIVTTIQSYAFQDCSALSSISFSDSVEIIEMYAFTGATALSSVTFGTGVTNIGTSAFRDCTALTDINYRGTMSQWGTITKGSRWHLNVPATVVHCSDGDRSL